MARKVVLSVGQCGPDHSALSSFLNQHFEVDILTADLPHDTMQMLQDQSVDLVLINRKLDADYTDGMEILKSIRDCKDLTGIPVMIVSNFEETQQEAIACGGQRGFGKDQLGTPRARQVVADALQI